MLSRLRMSGAEIIHTFDGAVGKGDKIKIVMYDRIPTENLQMKLHDRFVLSVESPFVGKEVLFARYASIHDMLELFCMITGLNTIPKEVLERGLY